MELQGEKDVYLQKKFLIAVFSDTQILSFDKNTVSESNIQKYIFYVSFETNLFTFSDFVMTEIWISPLQPCSNKIYGRQNDSTVRWQREIGYGEYTI